MKKLFKSMLFLSVTALSIMYADFPADMYIDLTQPPTDDFYSSTCQSESVREKIEHLVESAQIFNSFPDHLNKGLTAVCYNPSFKYKHADRTERNVLCAAYKDQDGRLEVRLYELVSGNFEVLATIKWPIKKITLKSGKTIPVSITAMSLDEQGVLAVSLYGEGFSVLNFYYFEGDQGPHTQCATRIFEGRITGVELRGNDLYYAILSGIAYHQEDSLANSGFYSYKIWHYNICSMLYSAISDCFSGLPIVQMRYSKSAESLAVKISDSEIKYFLLSKIKTYTQKIHSTFDLHQYGNLLKGVVPDCVKCFVSSEDMINYRIRAFRRYQSLATTTLLVALNLDRIIKEFMKYNPFQNQSNRFSGDLQKQKIKVHEKFRTHILCLMQQDTILEDFINFWGIEYIQ